MRGLLDWGHRPTMIVRCILRLRLGGLKSRNVFLTVLKARHLRLRCWQFVFCP